MTAPALAFDTDHGRYYRHPGNSKTVPSITNIKSKKHVELKGWAARKCADFAADNIGQLAGLDRDMVYTLVKDSVYKREANSPSEIGDQVHNWIENFVKGGNAPEIDFDDWATATTTAKGMWKQFYAFVYKHNPEFTLSEFTVWSDVYDYAGTGDIGMRFAGKHALIDTKTGTRVYPDVAMQLAALGHADYIIDENGEQKELPLFEAYGILHLRPRSAKLVPVFHIDEWFKAFLGLRELFRVDVEYADKTLGYPVTVKA